MADFSLSMTTDDIKDLLSKGGKLITCVYYPGGYPQSAVVYSPDGTTTRVRRNFAAKITGCTIPLGCSPREFELVAEEISEGDDKVYLATLVTLAVALDGWNLEGVAGYLSRTIAEVEPYFQRLKELDFNNDDITGWYEHPLALTIFCLAVAGALDTRIVDGEREYRIADSQSEADTLESLISG